MRTTLVVGGAANLLMIAAGRFEAGVIGVLQHRPGDPYRPWKWAKVIQQICRPSTMQGFTRDFCSRRTEGALPGGGI